MKQCSNCKGKGRIAKNCNEDQGDGSITYVETDCPKCGGTGNLPDGIFDEAERRSAARAASRLQYLAAGIANCQYVDAIAAALDVITNRFDDRGSITDRTDKYIAAALVVKSERKAAVLEKYFTGQAVLTNDNIDTVIDDVAYTLELLRRIISKIKSEVKE